MSAKKITDNQIRLVAECCKLTARLRGKLRDLSRLLAGSVSGAPRMERIAEIFGVSVRQAQRDLNDLAASGAIGIARRYMIVGGKARQISNVYTVMVSPFAAAMTAGREYAKRLWRWRASCRIVVTEEHEKPVAMGDISVSPIANEGFQEEELAEIRSRLALRERERRELEARFYRRRSEKDAESEAGRLFER